VSRVLEAVASTKKAGVVEQTVAAVSVVVPARNAALDLPRQLAALAVQDYDGEWEVIVADNGSTDDTADLVRATAVDFPVPLRVVETSTAPGINVGRNEGARQATSDALLFCDADDIVSPAWVRSLAMTLDEFDLAGGPIELERLNSEWAIRVRPMGAPLADRGFVFPIGANLGCRRSVWEELGGFDERFNHGGWDESDFCYRAQIHGFRVGTAPEAIVHYRLRSDLRGFVRQQWGIGRGERLFRSKHPEFLPALSPRIELHGLARSAIGLVRRTVTRAHDRDAALGWVAFQGGRIYEAAALAAAPHRHRGP
jgi:glycosyltransferase involved in cell wall biosynthesis